MSFMDDLMGMLTSLGGYDPAVAATMANNPEAIIPHLVEAGVEPPAGTSMMPVPEGATPAGGLSTLTGKGLDQYGNPLPGSGLPSDNLTGTPVTPGSGFNPMQPATPPTTPGAAPPLTQAATLSKMLQGITAPTAPDTQRIATPHAPQPNAISMASPFAALLQNLDQPPQQPQMLRLREALLGGR